MAVRRYFLGANTAKGFFSVYEDFCKPDSGNFLYVIKGGPGCGKSSFMKKIGKAAEDDMVEGFQSVDENTKFYINKDGNPVVCFEKYEVAPGYMGFQEFEIDKPAE